MKLKASTRYQSISSLSRILISNYQKDIVVSLSVQNIVSSEIPSLDNTADRFFIGHKYLMSRQSKIMLFVNIIVKMKFTFCSLSPIHINFTYSSLELGQYVVKELKDQFYLMVSNLEIDNILSLCFPLEPVLSFHCHV